MDAKASILCDSALFGQADMGEFVVAGLKNCDCCRITIQLDDPANTPATVVLKAIDQARQKVKAGKRVELRFTYLIEVKKG